MEPGSEGEERLLLLRAMFSYRLRQSQPSHTVLRGRTLSMEIFMSAGKCLGRGSCCIPLPAAKRMPELPQVMFRNRLVNAEGLRFVVRAAVSAK